MKLGSAIDQLVVQRIHESMAVKQLLLKDDEYLCCVTQVAQEMAHALRCGKKLVLFGNGGSAADAQHLAAELTGRYLLERPGLPALALTANTSALTAIANDYSFDSVFSRQLEGLGFDGDVAIGITTSGNSTNILKAMEVARAKGLITVALTGRSGGQLRSLVDHCIRIPSDETPRIQEAHILTGHILCEMVESELFEAGNLS